ncbi:MAG TPA: hypothetical protein VFH31_10280, partial [Pyrinomonadaceae bacterium]|nr:hypothetical protein [Pyrinomonadaceae bacterium]
MTPKSPGLKVEHMTARTEAEYASFVERHPRGLLYLSVQYRDFLLRILPGCEPLYLLARDAGEVVGVLPLFVHHGSKYGAVINSLPFFGSNGGILVWEGSSQAAVIRHALLEEYLRLEQSCRVAASTLITSPFESVSSDYDALLGPPADTRIGQMSALPKAEG